MLGPPLNSFPIHYLPGHDLLIYADRKVPSKNQTRREQRRHHQSRAFTNVWHKLFSAASCRSFALQVDIINFWWLSTINSGCKVSGERENDKIGPRTNHRSLFWPSLFWLHEWNWKSAFPALVLNTYYVLLLISFLEKHRWKLHFGWCVCMCKLRSAGYDSVTRIELLLTEFTPLPLAFRRTATDVCLPNISLFNDWAVHKYASVTSSSMG